jgi:hypothetical protein
MSEPRPSQDQLESIVGVLAHARLRPGMYMDLSNTSAIRNYFYGFLMPLNLVGIELNEKEILVERGWSVGNHWLIAEMQKQGFTDRQITTEVFSILIIALMRQYNLSTEPVRQAHAKIRETTEKGLQADKLDPDTRTRYEYELEIMSSLEKDLGIL